MLRPLLTSDLSELLTIEQSVHESPWSAMTFAACFHAGYQGWIVETNGMILGFIIAAFTLDECHILNLSVRADYQRQGWGSKLLEYTLYQAQQRGVTVIYLEVRRSNVEAITLYQKMHFLLVAERKNYYSTTLGWEDALIFVKKIK